LLYRLSALVGDLFELTGENEPKELFLFKFKFSELNTAFSISLFSVADLYFSNSFVFSNIAVPNIRLCFPDENNYEEFMCK
jgi:hypothetical protein